MTETSPPPPPRPLGVYLIEPNLSYAESVLKAVIERPANGTRLKVVGCADHIPSNAPEEPVDIVVLEPMVNMHMALEEMLWRIAELFGSQVLIVLHSDTWTTSGMRNHYKRLGIVTGVAREQLLQLEKLLRQVAAGSNDYYKRYFPAP